MGFFDVMSAPPPAVPNPSPEAYDIYKGIPASQWQEMLRIRERMAPVGEQTRQGAADIMGQMGQVAQGGPSAQQAAARLAMARASQQANAAAQSGSPLAVSNALAGQAALQGQAGGASALKVAEEQQTAQQKYIAAAQAQRALDIQKTIQSELLAQKEAQMGLKSKWDTALGMQEMSRLQMQKAGIDLGVWDSASKLAAARQAALYGAVGAGLGTLSSAVNWGGGSGDAAHDAGHAAGYSDYYPDTTGYFDTTGVM